MDSEEELGRGEQRDMDEVRHIMIFFVMSAWNAITSMGAAVHDMRSGRSGQVDRFYGHLRDFIEFVRILIEDVERMEHRLIREDDVFAWLERIDREHLD